MAMTRKPAETGELFERDPKTGRKTDARIWDAMLDGDTANTSNVLTPEGRAALLRKYPKRGK